MTIDEAVQISRLFIPIIALAGIFIAWQQFRANREKVRIDLYQRRLDVYRVLLETIQATGYFDEDRDEAEVFRKLEGALDEAYFLLPEEIFKKIEPIKERARRICDMHWEADLLQGDLANDRGLVKKDDLEKNYKELKEKFHKEITWFQENAHDQLRGAFKEVLGFYKF